MQSTFADKSFPASGAVGIHHMPVQIIRAATQSVTPIPLVCDSPHSGTHYPADFGFAVNLTELRKCEDTHVEKLWASVPQYGGTLLQATFPRSYIDPNRAADDIDQAMLNSPWPGVCAPSKRCLELGNGLVFSKTPNLHSIYQRSLSVDDIKNRIENYWQPYRNALDDTLQTAGAQFGVRVGKFAWCVMQRRIY
jgi:N-formylglutamate deformylase